MAAKIPLNTPSLPEYPPIAVPKSFKLITISPFRHKKYTLPGACPHVFHIYPQSYAQRS
jgi:hypothetical protein